MVNLLTGPKGSGKTQQMIYQEDPQRYRKRRIRHPHYLYG